MHSTCIYSHFSFQYSFTINLIIHFLLGLLSGYTCNSCQKWFASQITLSRHKMWHHKSPTVKYRYNCSRCPYSTNEKTNFNNHSAVHQSDRKHQCSVCGNRFLNTSCLNKHMIIHVGEAQPLFNPAQLSQMQLSKYSFNI